MMRGVNQNGQTPIPKKSECGATLTSGARSLVKRKTCDWGKEHERPKAPALQPTMPEKGVCLAVYPYACLPSSPRPI